MAGKREVLLTDEQWERVKPFIPEVPTTRRGGRPRADDRACFKGIFVGTSQRSTLEGSAGLVSFAKHLLATISRVGRGRRLRRYVACVHRSTR